MTLDMNGALVDANSSARALATRVGAALVEGEGLDSLFAGIDLLDGGSPKSWAPDTKFAGLDAALAAPPSVPAREVFELRTEPRRGRDGLLKGWLVRLIDLTPLVVALRGRKVAVDQRDQLLKLLSHDMRAPMAAILSTLKHPGLADMPAELKQIIESSAYRALKMVDSNVRLIRAQSTDYAMEVLDFGHVVEEVVDASWSLSKEVDVKILLEPTNIDLSIIADRGSITDALTGLVSRFLNEGKGGGRLLCSFDVGSLRGSPAVTLTVRESGGGAEFKERFQTRSDRTVSPRGEEASIDYVPNGEFLMTVVARHGGVIVDQSTSDVGQSVSITIPTSGPATTLTERNLAT